MANISVVLEEEDNQYQDVLLEEIHKQGDEDPEYELLKKTIVDGFPDNNNELHITIRPYANVKDLLCIDEDLIVCGQRLLIPRKMRKEVLKLLHSSHQGIERTRQRARQSVYWPGINNDIENTVKTCQECQKLLPSLQKEPMKVEVEPTRPFQSVSTDYFDHAGKHYLIYTDRLSGWPMVQMFNQGATATKLITTLRKFFSATGVPEILRSDNGPQFTAGSFKNFLHQWAVRHKTSSPYYPQSNGHAEASVKAIKHLIIKSTKNGNMDTDEFALGLLELRNAPRVDGQSPAQALFGHPIRSILPVHKRAYEEEWQRSKVQTKGKREEARKYAELKYNLAAKPLPEFKVGCYVNVQDYRTGRWTINGMIIEVGQNRQYLIKKKDGRSIWRNRKFIRKHHPILSSESNTSPEHTDEQIHCQSPIRYHTTSPQSSPQSIPQSIPQPIPLSIPQPKSPPRLILYKNKLNNNSKLPSTVNDQPPHPMGSRTRQAPPRLQVDPKRKTYNQNRV